MAVLVDTNIIVDVITEDPNWGDWSIAMLDHYDRDGLLINPMIYTELCYGFKSQSDVDNIVKKFGLALEEIPRPALFMTSKAFANYRKRGGNKIRPLPDFFIGAHAQARHYPLITRDATRYKSYFPNVTLITPNNR